MLTVGAVRDARARCYPYDSFIVRYAAVAVKTIQETVKNGRHWLLGLLEPFVRNPRRRLRSRIKFDQSSGRMISKVQLQTGGGVYGKFGRRKGAGI